MIRNSNRVVAVSLVCFSVASDRLAALNCRNCRGPLDLHQPNPSQPDQFLATCSECNCWFRVEAKSGESRATVIQLPEAGQIDPPSSAPGTPS